MSDYLWDPAHDPDPEVKAFEERLASLRRDPPPLPELPDRSPGLPPAWRRAFLATPFLLAASLLLVVAALGFLSREDGWEVRWAGERRTRLSPGEWLDTGAASAQLAVGWIGTLRLEPGTRLRLVSDAPTHHRVALERGTIHARIWAPPRRFFVETPVTTAIDLGCAYTLSTDEAGNGLLRVSAGWVSFERRTPEGVDEVVVPAGASCRVSASRGPGVPAWDDAPEAFRAALARLEAGTEMGASRDFDALLLAARAEDGLTLLALAPRLDAAGRDAIYQRLASLSPRVASLPRGPFVSGEAAARDAMRRALGLRTP